MMQKKIVDRIKTWIKLNTHFMTVYMFTGRMVFSLWIECLKKILLNRCNVGLQTINTWNWSFAQHHPKQISERIKRHTVINVMPLLKPVYAYTLLSCVYEWTKKSAWSTWSESIIIYNIFNFGLLKASNLTVHAASHIT